MAAAPPSEAPYQQMQLPFPWVQSLATGGMLATLMSTLRPLVSLLVFVLVFAAVMFFLKQLRSVSGGKGDDAAPSEGGDQPSGRADQMRLFAALAAQTRHLGSDEPLPERAFLMVSKSDCPSCAMLYTEFSTLDRLLPFLTKPGQSIPVLRLPFEEHMQTVRDIGVEAVPSFILKDGTSYHECPDLSVEEWVLFLRQRLPNIFAQSAVQNAADAAPKVDERRLGRDTSSSVKTMEPEPSVIIEELEETDTGDSENDSVEASDNEDADDASESSGDSPSSS